MKRQSGTCAKRRAAPARRGRDEPRKGGRYGWTLETLIELRFLDWSFSFCFYHHRAWTNSHLSGAIRADSISINSIVPPSATSRKTPRVKRGATRRGQTSDNNRNSSNTNTNTRNHNDCNNLMICDEPEAAPRRKRGKQAGQAFGDHPLNLDRRREGEHGPCARMTHTSRSVNICLCHVQKGRADQIRLAHGQADNLDTKNEHGKMFPNPHMADR